VTPDQARHAIEEALAQIAPDADVTGLAQDADLRDALELDSLDFLSLVEKLSQRTGRRIDEEDYPHLATLASAVKFLAGR
jgi:acyl carrier protein